jgi:CRP/FNR family cyclic AMP-dependent transcriptional regulator
MVFHSVERLDVVKMAKLVCDYAPGEMQLLDEVKPIFDIVETSVLEKKKGIEIDAVMARLGIFEGLDETGIALLGGICVERRYRAGETVFIEGSEGAEMYVVTGGCIEIRDAAMPDEPVAAVCAGEMFGEFALIDSLPRSMSAVCAEDATVLVLAKHDFERLMVQHADLGSRVYRNIAETLVSRLRRTNVALADYKLRYKE